MPPAAEMLNEPYGTSPRRITVRVRAFTSSIDEPYPLVM